MEPPSSEAAGGFRVVGQLEPRRRFEKKKPVEILLWQEAGRRLASYGLGAARMVADPNRGRNSAGERGWTAEQVLEFLDAIERETIDGERKWEPGAVWFQLVKCDPGTRISGMRPRESWQRANRNRDLRLAAERLARPAAAKPPVDLDKVAEWESRFARKSKRERAKVRAAQDAPPSAEAGGGDGDSPRPGGES